MTGIIGRILPTKVTIATTATAVPTTALVGRTTITVKNTGAATIYLGHAGVTTANGYPVASGAELALDLDEAVTLYGIVAADTVTLNILEGV